MRISKYYEIISIQALSYLQVIVYFRFFLQHEDITNGPNLMAKIFTHVIGHHVGDQKIL